MREPYDEVVAFVHALGAETRLRQMDALTVGRKPDRSVVTDVDRSNEAAIALFLRQHFPADSIQGEEGTRHLGTSEYSWLIDPIDGTRQFIRGQLFWGILIARMSADRSVFGSMYRPSTQSVIWAETGSGCFQTFDDGSPDQRLYVSETASIDEAYLLHNGLAFAARVDGGELLAHRCGRVDAEQGYADSFGHIEVIAGRSDVMLDCLAAPHDIAAVAVCVVEAGGAWFSSDGRPPSRPGDISITTNRGLADELRALLAARS